MSTIGGGAYLGGVAYDPLLGSGGLVYYGGQSPTALSNSTWLYAGLEWYNVSSDLALSPGPLWGQSMDFDPAWGGVILAGGQNGNGTGVGTWLFNDTGWFNITAETGSSPPAYQGAAAWDPSLQAFLYVDGCVLGSGCASQWTETWELTTTWSAPYLGPGNLTWAVSGESIAYDATDGGMLLYGGYDGTVDVNYTFEFNGTAWNNLTTTSVGCYSPGVDCGLYPQGFAYGQMTWDGQIGAIVLFGGFNSTSDEVLADSWTFQSGEWLPTYLYYGGNLPMATTEGSIAVNSSDVAPVLVGGIAETFGFATGVYAFEAPPNLTMTVTPNPAQTGDSVTVNVTVEAGTGSGPWAVAEISVNGTDQLLSSRYGIDFSTAWSFQAPTFTLPPGNYAVVASVDDWVYGYTEVNETLTVTPNLVVHATVNRTTTEVGLPVSFTGSATGGSGTYSTYAWTFGDSHSASTAIATHTYTAAGTYQVRLNVTDSDGLVNTTTLTVVVIPALVASDVTATPASPNPGTTLTFGVTVSGGDTPYTSYAWTFGDGATGTGAAPTHAYTGTGTYAVNVTVTDSLGVKSTTHLTVTVAAASSGTSGFSLTSGTGLYLLLGVIVVILVVGALLLTRRKKPATTSAPYGATGSGVPAGAGGAPPPPPPAA